MSDPHAARAAAFDVIAVVGFVAAGRRTHAEGASAFEETVKIAAPFLIGLAAGWLAARAWRRPEALVTGAGIWIVTVVVGLVLRRTLFDRGTAASFVVVATVVTGSLLVGWRAVHLLLARRRIS